MANKNRIVEKFFTIVLRQKQVRQFSVKKIDDYIYDKMVKNYSGNHSPEVQLARYYYISAALNSVNNNLNNGNISYEFIKRIKPLLIGDDFLHNGNNFKTYRQGHFDYKSKYGLNPPGFVAISPTQKCNLQCVGCYASSNNETTQTLPYNYVTKIIDDVYNNFCRRFIVISGGEPFMYKSENKTIMDVFEKYPDVFFLVFTNGTLINADIAEKMSRFGNVTVAISVEGYEYETDARRGIGVYKKIKKSIGYLQSYGVPFGISVTATSKNIDLLLNEDFYDFYFNEIGATYMWQFQMMPIGKAGETLDLVVPPKQRIELYKFWTKLVKNKKYPIADFWNNAIISNGCIAYGSEGGYIYVDWNGNIMPCVFVPYYVDNIYDIYGRNLSLADAVMSDFMKNGRQWQNINKGINYHMPCSIRDHYSNFKHNILTKECKPENREAAEALTDEEYYDFMICYDTELAMLTDINLNDNMKYD